MLLESYRLNYKTKMAGQVRFELCWLCYRRKCFFLVFEEQTRSRDYQNLMKTI